MGVVQLHPVKTGLLRAPRSRGKQTRQHLWQLLDMRPFCVGDALTRTHVQRLPFPRIQHLGPLLGVHLYQVFTHRFLAPVLCTQGLAQTRCDAQKALKVFGRLGAAADVEKVNDLDQCTGLALAFAVDGLHQTLQAFDIAVMANAQQRAAGHIADAGGFDHDGARSTARKAAIPLQHIFGHPAFIVGAPWHHGRHPGALQQGQRTDMDRAEQARGLGLFSAGRMAQLAVKLDTLGRFPHKKSAPCFQCSGQTSVESIQRLS